MRVKTIHRVVLFVIGFSFVVMGSGNSNNTNRLYFEYAILGPMEFNGTWGLDVKGESYSVRPKNGLDEPSYPMKYCSSGEELICFYPDEDSSIIFSVPRRGMSLGESWTFRGVNFEVFRNEPSLKCGDNYFIKSNKGSVVQIFIFNYYEGLRLIAEAGRAADVDKDSMLDTFAFNVILYANGVGFGATKTCVK